MPVLSEYESVTLDLTRHQAEALQRTGFVEVAPAQQGRWRIASSSYVGTLVVEGVELLIRPKINPENLFLLLEPGLPPHAWHSEAFDYESSSDLLPSAVAFFARTVETTLGRGVLRSYQPRQDALVALRGRMDLAGQFKRAGVLTPTACSYDDFSEDIAENRVLRAAIRRCVQVPRVDPADRQRLMRQLVALEDVADVAVRPEQIDAIHRTRLNEHYWPALGLARLVIANLTLADARGSTSASSFMVDMNELFQRFITQRVRRALRGRMHVVDEPVVHLGLGRQVSMQPDLVFRDLAGQEVQVGDVKYKLAADGRGRSADYYQLLAYTTAMGLREGILIYCRRRGDTAERRVIVRNAGTKLILRAVDLTGSPAEVEKEISELASSIDVRAEQAAWAAVSQW